MKKIIEFDGWELVGVNIEEAHYMINIDYIVSATNFKDRPTFRTIKRVTYRPEDTDGVFYSLIDGRQIFVTDDVHTFIKSEIVKYYDNSEPWSDTNAHNDYSWEE